MFFALQCTNFKQPSGSLKYRFGLPETLKIMIKQKFNQIFSWFENRINPYPDDNPTTPEKGLFPFIWSSLKGMRGWVLILAIFSAGNGILEALLFQFMGNIVDWLGKYTPQTLFTEHGWSMFGINFFSLLAIW